MLEFIICPDVENKKKKKAQKKAAQKKEAQKDRQAKLPINKISNETLPNAK